MHSTAPVVNVALPEALRSLCGQETSARPVLRLTAGTVRDLLLELARVHPQVHIRVCDESGQPRQHINVFVNEDHVRARAGLDTSLSAGDTVSILPAVSGG